MISIKSNREIELLRIAGNIVHETREYLRPFIKEGITTKELDTLAEEFILSKGATPSFKGLNDFPCATCISINQEVVHGIPSDRKLRNGDIVTLDIGACYKGYHGDSAWTYAVGEISEERKYLMEHTEKSLYEGLAVIKPGAHIGDIGHAVQTYAEAHNLGVVRELVGHGVGTNVHESPDVPNYGKEGTGPLLKEGMVIAIEPMLTFGSEELEIDENGLTAYTYDGSNAAHFEHTIAITKEGPIILTGVDRDGKE